MQPFIFVSSVIFEHTAEALAVFTFESLILTFCFFHLIGGSTPSGYEIAILLSHRRRRIKYAVNYCGLVPSHKIVHTFQNVFFQLRSLNLPHSLAGCDLCVCCRLV